MFQHGSGLRERDAWEQLNELTDGDTVFKILEQGGDWHARAAEHPSSAHTLGVVLHHRTA